MMDFGKDGRVVSRSARAGLVASCLASLLACGQVTESQATHGTGGVAQGGNAASAGGEQARGGEPMILSSGGTGGALVRGSGGEMTSPGGATTGGIGDSFPNGRPTHAARPCESPFEKGGGTVACLDGSSRRLEPSECEARSPRAEAGNLCHDGDECCEDTDCVDRPLGFCSGSACRYGCISDADCGDGVCACGGWMGVCVFATCHGAADCPPDFPCSAGSGTYADYACQTPFDECLTDRDCGLGPAKCSTGPEGRICIHLPG